ncbi:MAG: septum formation inhibitor Maf [Cycloclasticus sp. symbiont of Poecilosclerida sp. M]|nr:MAG: septum formation inhibitor Maf [Cycloclasticus sp. symbiont of Poecilosclerida sp. M]
MKKQPNIGIVLASSSLYRRELLTKICPEFENHNPDIDESARVNESPLVLSQRLATEKAQALATIYPKHLIIGSDQVAMLSDKQLSKPGSHAKAVQQLQSSSGKVIGFYTSLCVLNTQTNTQSNDVDVCRVYMKTLSLEEIESYVNREKPFNCAASFKSEGLGIVLFEKIEGDDPNALIGLPLIKLAKLLALNGYKVL